MRIFKKISQRFLYSLEICFKLPLKGEINVIRFETG